MSDKKEFQEKLLLYQLLENKINSLMKRRDLVLNKIMEIGTTISSLEELDKNKGEDILFPLGSNTFIPGTIKKKEKVIVELGANVAVEKDIEKTKEILQVGKNNLQTSLQTIEKELITSSREMAKLEPEIRSMVERTNASSETSAG
jgi:prefoldin alpha subunit